jgi:hypothetical protein
MSLDTAGVPSDITKLLDGDEHIYLYMKQKKYHPAIHLESIAVTNKRVIFRKPSMLHTKKSYTDYSYADILNVTIDKGPLRSTIKLNLRIGPSGGRHSKRRGAAGVPHNQGRDRQVKGKIPHLIFIRRFCMCGHVGKAGLEEMHVLQQRKAWLL